MVVDLNTVNKQIEILNKISNIMNSSVNFDCEGMLCRFESDMEDDSVSQEFYFIRDGKKISGLLNDPDWLLMDLVLDLQNEMLKHTGGKWVAFTLTIDKDGKAKANFDYPEDSNNEK